MIFFQIIGYVLYAILLFITITWVYGVRVKPLAYPTVLTSLYFLIASIVFSLIGINKIHLLWVIPLIYLSSFLNIVLIQTPIISIPLRIICDIYASILRIGVNKARLDKERISDARLSVENWVEKQKK